MDRTLEFISFAESKGYDSSSGSGNLASWFVLKAANLHVKISAFEGLLDSLSSSYVGYNSSAERRNMNREILIFVGNISSEMKSLNRFLEGMNSTSLQYVHNKQKLQEFMSASDKMQVMHQKNNISPFRLLTSTSKALHEDRWAGADNPGKDSASSSSKSGFASRYVDEIAPQSKMNEYKSIAAKHKESLLKEAKVLQTRFSDDLEQSLRMEQEVSSISRLLNQFVVMIEAQKEVVVDVSEFSLQSTRTVKQAGEELQLTLDRTKSHQWSMVILILGFSLLLLLLDVLTP